MAPKDLGCFHQILSRRLVLARGGFLLGSSALGLWVPRTWAAERRGQVVRTAAGTVRGAVNDGIHVFKGIHYGTSTAATNRFLPPRPVAPWTGVKDALAYGPPCIQTNTDFSAWVDTKPASEDCLVLNVWSPALGSSNKRPVMCWIHGGGYSSGSGGLPIYDGKNLSKRGDVVVVTVNHRLNVFGYTYLANYGREFADASNAGQRDLVLALQWVRDNVSSFGGDPGNVTIFGESGGGGKISSLLATPSAKGLFHKAIVESGSLGRAISSDVAEKGGAALLAELGLQPNQIEELQKVPGDQLRTIVDAINRKHLAPGAFAPAVDGRFVPNKTWDPAAPDASATVPMIIGTNGEEAAATPSLMESPPTDDATLRDAINMGALGGQVPTDQADIFIKAYQQMMPNASPLDVAVQICTDNGMWKNAIRQAELKAAQNTAKAFMYNFRWKTPCFGGMWALHGIEIPFVFDNLDYGVAWDGKDSTEIRNTADPKNERFALADKTLAAWAAFAHTGDPSNDKLGQWPAYSLTRRETMILNAKCEVQSDPRSDFRKFVMSF
jgi:para-nitrobenzyl esterase